MILDRYKYAVTPSRKMQSLRKIKRLIHLREMNYFEQQSIQVRRYGKTGQEISINVWLRLKCTILNY